MWYFTAKGRCVINISQIGLSINRSRVLSLLGEEGFAPLDINILDLARSCLGASFKRGADLAQAPHCFDCSGFTKWLFAQKGIWLPRLSVQQREYGRRYGRRVGLRELVPCDLIFTLGNWNWIYDDVSDEVGHVGMATSGEMVIHATNGGVIECSLEAFLEDPCYFRAAYRILPLASDVVTLQIPDGYSIESSDDVRCLLLKRLGKLRRF